MAKIRENREALKELTRQELIGTVATVVIALSTVVNVIVSGFLWWTTRQSTSILESAFRVSNRPYVAVSITHCERDESNHTIVALSQLDNAGNVPASNVIVTMEISLSGAPFPSTSLSLGNKFPRTLLPHGSNTITSVAGSDMYDGIVAGTTPWQVTMVIEYDGIFHDHYRSTFKGQYDPRLNILMSLGGEAN